MQNKNMYYQVLGYVLCAILVVFFVNLYSVWAVASKLLPPQLLTILPIAAGATLTAAALFYFLKRKAQSSRQENSLILLGGAICLLALFLPDSQYPVKRIHVVEYMILVCLVRYVMSLKIQGKPLLIYSVLVTVLFGIHDELLQGIHPSRTYGLRDMLVNGVSALGGGLIWHGGLLFTKDLNNSESMQGRHVAVCYLFFLFLSVLAFIVPLTVYRQETIPYWPLMPLSGAMVAWTFYSQEVFGAQKYGCLVVSCLAYLFFLYPVTINVLAYNFF